MRAWPRIHFAITLGLLAGAFVLAATPLEDAKCTVEDVTIVRDPAEGRFLPCPHVPQLLRVLPLPQANAAQLRYIVQELVNTTYFRLFRVNLDSDLCPFWHRNPSGPSCSVAPDAEETCSVQPENILGAPDVGIPWGPTTDGVNRSLSQAQDDIHVAGVCCHQRCVSLLCELSTAACLCVIRL